MNKIDCKVGMEIKVYKIPRNGRRRNGFKNGKIIGLYENYAMILLDSGFRECFFYRDIFKKED